MTFYYFIALPINKYTPNNIFIIKGFWTIVFIFIVISTICPPAFFKCLSNSGEPTQNFKLRPLLNPRGFC